MGNRLDRVIGNIFGAEKNYKKCIESSLKCDRKKSITSHAPVGFNANSRTFGKSPGWIDEPKSLLLRAQPVRRWGPAESAPRQPRRVLPDVPGGMQVPEESPQARAEGVDGRRLLLPTVALLPRVWRREEPGDVLVPYLGPAARVLERETTWRSG